MNTNRDVLRSLILEVFDCFIAKGTVTDLRLRVIETATAAMRRQFTTLREEICTAGTVTEIGEVVTRARLLSVRYNFFIPRTDVLLYERFTTVKYLHSVGVLDSVDWTRVKR